ncbi:MarR family transcriptional regulator [Mycobacterium sp. SM1]|uniref:MarR family winged helix-turn-helix transcriptional regulator n=1 Tax=Mycobacterium sp. SM1 TaxID=2816243 RepID=UPI001BCDEF10|nr:MarR family transcriptional regulator [Mycobacterium sp. SM1]MBS4728173.1 MarR family transcriptional regulator [Mycobacterium sp. SM1]
MGGPLTGRTGKELPGLDIAEQRSWQNFLDTTLRLPAMLNRRLADAHRLSLADVRVLEILDGSPTGSARMGDLADALPALPSRLTRQIRRLETDGLVRRGTSPDDARGVVATITDEGRAVAERAMVTYAEGVRTYFVGRLSRSQLAAIAESCRRINAGLKPNRGSAKSGRR